MTTSEPTAIPAGAIFTMTTGSFLDYMVRGVFRALKDIELSEIAKHVPRHKYGYSESEMGAFLVRNGYMEPIDSFEFHLSDDWDSKDGYWLSYEEGEQFAEKGSPSPDPHN